MFMKSMATFAALISLTVPMAWGQSSKIPRLPDKSPTFRESGITLTFPT